MKRYLRSIYWSIKKVIAPDVISSQTKYAEVLKRHLETRPRWLDLGCGHQFLPDWAWVPDEKLLRSLPRIVGVDTDFASLKQHPLLKDCVQSDIASLPFPRGSFDLITANMVMEHVAHPESVLDEVCRVLAPGGVFLLHTPNRASPLVSLAARIPKKPKNWLVGFFEDRREEDIYPAVYKLNTVSTIAASGARAGFHLESCDLVVSEAVTQIFGPLAIFELLYIRITQTKRCAKLRPDLIAVLRTAEAPAAIAVAAAAGAQVGVRGR
jgi:SAM-dependent methyltransferase